MPLDEQKRPLHLDRTGTAEEIKDAMPKRSVGFIYAE
jgi:hypothetical protein